MYSYINYTNYDDLVFALLDINEFTFIKDKYKEVIIDDLKYNNRVKNILGYVPNTYDEFIDIACSNKEIAKVIEDIFLYIYKAVDPYKALLSDVTGKKLYIVDGTQSNYDARLDKFSDVNKIYLLNQNIEDYVDIFGHKVMFHINNEFINK